MHNFSEELPTWNGLPWTEICWWSPDALEWELLPILGGWGLGSSGSFENPMDDTEQVWKHVWPEDEVRYCWTYSRHLSELGVTVNIKNLGDFLKISRFLVFLKKKKNKSPLHWNSARHDSDWAELSGRWPFPWSIHSPVQVLPSTPYFKIPTSFTHMNPLLTNWCWLSFYDLLLVGPSKK